MKRIMLLAIAMLLVSTGCIGLIVNGSTEQISFNSSPSGAEVTVNGGFVGVTPLVTNLSRGESHQATINLAGYQTESFNIAKTASGGIIISDIILTGGIGLLIDFVTGSLYNLNPTDISTSLDNISVNGNSIEVALIPNQ